MRELIIIYIVYRSRDLSVYLSDYMAAEEHKQIGAIDGCTRVGFSCCMLGQYVGLRSDKI